MLSSTSDDVVREVAMLDGRLTLTLEFDVTMHNQVLMQVSCGSDQLGEDALDE
jgi:hypothetical protein